MEGWRRRIGRLTASFEQAGHARSAARLLAAQNAQDVRLSFVMLTWPGTLLLPLLHPPERIYGCIASWRFAGPRVLSLST